MTTPNERQLSRFEGWIGGINNAVEETAVPRASLRQAVNVELSDDGKIRRRTGYTLRVAGSAHSAFNATDAVLAVVDNDLKAFDKQLNATLVRSSVGEQPISYAVAGSDVYWSNGSIIRRATDEYVDAPVWLSNPGQPTLSVSATGGLTAGAYQVAITYLDAGGRESGASLAELITVPEGGGIQLNSIPNNADAVRCRIYVSQANSETLYAARDIPVGMSQWTIGVGQRGKSLETQFLEPMPAGQVVRAHDGRLLVGSANYLWWSEALRYGLCAPFNFIRYGHDLDMVEPVSQGGSAGVFVACGGRTYYLDGSDPSKWNQVVAYHGGVVRGTAMQAPANLFGLDVRGNVAYWLAKNGVFCVGTPGGRVIQLTESKYFAPINAEAGASLLRRKNGLTQFLTTARGGNDNVARATDSIVGTIRRNGITL